MTHRRKLILITGLMGLGILPGCGNSSNTGGSCSVVNGGFTTCFDYTGSGYTSASGQTACAGTTTGGAVGTYSATACATAGRVGSCTVNSGQATEQIVRYFTGYNSTTAQAACTGLSGTYTSG